MRYNKLFLVCMSFLFLMSCDSRNRYKLVNSSFTMNEGDVVNQANNIQYNAAVWMGVYEGRLLFYPCCSFASRKTRYDGCLCMLCENGIEIIKRLSTKGATVFAMEKGKVFFQVESDHDVFPKGFYCYDLEYKQLNQLSDKIYSPAIFHKCDGSLAIPLDDHESGIQTSFLQIDEEGNWIIGPLEEYYHLEDTEYCVVPEIGNRNSYGGGHSIFFRQNGKEWKELPLDYAKSRSIISTQAGLLIHNRGGTELLYLLDKNANMKLLFSVPFSLSDSCITVSGSKAFISVTDRLQSGKINLGKTPVPPNKEAGLYRVDLNDYSVEKISNGIYNGLFCFDESYLLACDDYCNVYQLDFDGNVIGNMLLCK